MRLCFVVALFLSSFSILRANNPEKIVSISSKVILNNSNGYFGMSDGSCWKVITFIQRWRTMSEWWYDVQLIPENYDCVPNNWFVGAEIEVYPKYGNLTIKESDASNQLALQQCTHLLHNARNGQILFAIELHPAEALIQLHTDAYKDGYNSGHEVGYREGYANGNSSKADQVAEAYDKGYVEGHETGYKSGWHAACESG